MGRIKQSYWTKVQIGEILDRFGRQVDSRTYTKRIPYDQWRKIKKAPDGVVIQYNEDTSNVSIYIGNTSYSLGERIYTESINDNGFARFFYTNYVKGDKDMSEVNYAAKLDLTATKASTADALASCSSHSSYSTVTDKVATNIDWNNYNTTISDRSSWITLPDYSADISNLNKKVDELSKQCDTYFNKNKEDKKMKGFNFDFGPCGNGVRLSMYGLAIQNIAGEWVSYNTASNEVINVDILNIADGGKYLYRLPVGLADIAVGDVVVHNRVPMFVNAVNDDGTLTVVDVREGVSKNILLTKNMFGFAFATKVVSLFGAFSNAPSPDQPFGNMLPFLMMGEDNKEMDPMMLMMFMQNGDMNISATGFNPMMMYMLMKDKKDIDPMMLMFMMNTSNGKRIAQ